MTRLIDKAAAAVACGYSPTHIMRLAKQGRFPTPIRLGSSPQHAVRFLQHEVDAWIEDKVARRENAPPTIPSEFDHGDTSSSNNGGMS